MFEHFTDVARHTVELARSQAVAVAHHSASSEHLLLAFFHEETDGGAAYVLRSLGIGQVNIRDAVQRIAGQRTSPDEHIVLAVAEHQALQRGHAQVDTEHILLGILDESKDDELVDDILRVLGVSRNEVRQTVITQLGRLKTEHEDEQFVVGRFSEQGKRMKSHSTKEARRLGHGKLDAGHFILGGLIMHESTLSTGSNHRVADVRNIIESALNRRLVDHGLEPADESEPVPDVDLINVAFDEDGRVFEQHALPYTEDTSKAIDRAREHARQKSRRGINDHDLLLAALVLPSVTKPLSAGGVDVEAIRQTIV